jgi:CheY-like chemotaxis protein
MAPEIAFSNGRSGVVTLMGDVYSVACVAYHVLTGKLPVDGPTELALLAQHAVADVVAPSTHRSDLPAQLDRVLLDALEKNPKKRTPSVEALRLGLQTAWHAAAEPERILVAEDDRDFLDALSIELSAEFPNTEIVCVGDGSEALRVSKQKAPSLALLDLQMPELDGVAVTRSPRSRKESANIPIIILTAAGGPKEWQLLRQLGADKFLVKPVDLDDVVLLIRRLLRESKGAARPVG